MKYGESSFDILYLVLVILWGVQILKNVRIKTASGMGVSRRKAEYEDLAAIAEKNGVSLNEVRGAVESKRE
jgi:uncharacterized protein (DUF111 family)